MSTMVCNNKHLHANKYVNFNNFNFIRTLFLLFYLASADAQTPPRRFRKGDQTPSPVLSPSLSQQFNQNQSPAGSFSFLDTTQNVCVF